MPLAVNTEPLERRSARDLVFERLLSWIQDGTLAPGQTIKDTEVAELLGVSRTPVREALQMLEQLGTVETTPGRSTQVSEARPSDAPLIYMPLAALHGLAAALATPRLSKASLDEMEAENERLRVAVDAGDSLGARQHDEAFHRIIVDGADNRFLADAINRLTTHSRRLETLYFSHAPPAHESCAEHAQIVGAMRNQDPALARSITEHQWLRTISVLAVDQ